MGGIKACIRLPLPFLPSGNSTERSFLKVQPCRLLMSCKLEAGQGRRCGFLELEALPGTVLELGPEPTGRSPMRPRPREPGSDVSGQRRRAPRGVTSGRG